MAHPDHARWKQGWRANQIAFHLDHVHPLLIRFWSSLDLHGAERVFVPLCGKSLDLMWLHARGHDVVGVELSPVAVRDFFKAAGLQPKQTYHGALTSWTQERLAIHCGDFFALKPADLLGVRAVYDRAALTALPEDLRERYVAHLAVILPADCHILLLTVEDLDDADTASEYMASSDEILALYAGHFTLELAHSEYHLAVLGDGGETIDPRCVHKVYRLHPPRSRPTT